MGCFTLGATGKIEGTHHLWCGCATVSCIIINSRWMQGFFTVVMDVKFNLKIHLISNGLNDGYPNFVFVDATTLN